MACLNSQKCRVKFNTYGNYTKMTEGVNNQSSYQSDFFDGIYGIWLADCNEWMIGIRSKPWNVFDMKLR